MASAISVESLEDRTLLTVTSAFNTTTGVLTVNVDAADNVLVTNAGGNVLINGFNPDSGALATTAVLQIDVLATGSFSNTFDLSTVTSANFTNLISNRLVGAAGDDILIGSELVDAIEGGDGNDQLIGGRGNDRYEFFLSGGSGSQHDVIDETGGGIDYVGIFTESGGATLDLNIAGPQSVTSGVSALTLTLGSGSTIEDASANFGGNLLTGNVLDNRLDGGGTLIGGPGNDILSNGGDGTDDTFIGGAGDDTYEFFDAAVHYGVDTIDETGGGTDTLSFEQYQSTVTLNAGATGSSQAVHANQSLIIANGSTLEVLVGGIADDSLTAAPGVNTTLRGLLGDDTLIGSTGNDTLEIDEGQDTLRGGAGNDTYSAILGNLPGTDLIDELSGSGIDTLSLATYDNFDSTGVTVDLDSTSAQTYYGGAANYTLNGQIESFTGSAFADTIDIAPLAGVTRTVDGASPTGGVIGDTLTVDLMTRPFNHTPGVAGNGIVDVNLMAGVGTVNYASIESLTLPNGPASTHDVYVDDDFILLNNGDAIADADPNTAGNQPATFGIDAFATIQGGVNAVANNGTVHIIDGMYAESVAIAKPLTLNGTGPRGNIVIDPANSGLTNGITLTAGADDVTIQHLRVTDAPGNGIAGIGIKNLKLEDVEVDSVTTDGFYGENLAIDFTVIDSTFSLNGGDGIEIVNSPSAIITFTDVIATRNDPGLMLNGVAAFSDTDGNYSDNDNGGIVLIDIGGSVDLLRTTLNNNDADLDGTGDGLGAFDGADSDFVAIAGNLTLQGVTAEDSDGTAVTKSQRHGIQVSGVAGTTTVENAPVSPGPPRSTSLRNNRETGMSLTATVGAVSFADPIISGNENSNLIIADAASQVSIDGGTYDDSGNGGGILVVSTNSDVVLDQVTAGNNRNNGILIDTASAVSMLDVTALNNQEAGTRIENAASLSDIDGDYRGNDAHGLYVIDIAESVGLVRTRLEDNATGSGEVGDGFHAADGGDADPHAIAGNLNVSGITAKSTGAITNHSQQRGVFVASLGGSLTLDESNAMANTITDNMSSGVLVADGGTTATVTRGLYQGNGLATGGAGIELHGFNGLVTTTQVAARGNEVGLLINSVGEYQDTESQISGSTGRGLELRDIFGNATLDRTMIRDNTGEGLLAADGADAGNTDAIDGSLFLYGVTIEDQAGIGPAQQTGVSVDGVGVGVFLQDAASLAQSSRVSGHSGTGILTTNVGSTGGLGAGTVSFSNVTLTGNGAAFRTVNATQQTLSNATMTGNLNASSLEQLGTLSLTTGATDEVVTVSGSSLEHSVSGVSQSDISFTVDTRTVRVDTKAGTDSVSVNASRPMLFDLLGGDPTSNPGGDTLTIDGGGNQITLLAGQNPGSGTGGPQIAHTEFENLTITNAAVEIVGTGKDDLLEVSATAVDAGTIQLTTDFTGTPTAEVPVTVLGLKGLTFNAGLGNDKLAITNPASGVFLPSNGTTLDAEQLVISGGQANEVIHQFARPVADYPQGPLVINGVEAYRTTSGTLTAFLEERTNTKKRNFAFETAAANVATLTFGIADFGTQSDGLSALLQSTTSSNSAPALTDHRLVFASPTEELVVEYTAPTANGGSREEFYLITFDQTFDADVTLKGVKATSFYVGPKFGLANRVVSIGSGDLTVTGDSIRFHTFFETRGGEVDITTSGPVEFNNESFSSLAKINAIGSGSVSIKAANIRMIANASIEADAGNLTLISRGGNLQVDDISTNGILTLTSAQSILQSSLMTKVNVMRADTAYLFAPNGNIGAEGRTLETQINRIEGSAGGSFDIANNRSLIVGLPGGTNGIVAGESVHINQLGTAGATLLLNEDVISARGTVLLETVDRLAVNPGVSVNATDTVNLRSRLEILLEATSAITGNRVELSLDDFNQIASETVLQAQGTINVTGGGRAEITGGDDIDRIVIKPGATDRLSPLVINGGGNADEFTFHIEPELLSADFDVNGGTGLHPDSKVTIEGSGLAETFDIRNSNSDLIDVGFLTPSGAGNYKFEIDLVTNIEVKGNDGADTVKITPQQGLAKYALRGGNPASTPGDTLVIDTTGRSVSFTPTTFFVDQEFRSVEYSEFEQTTARNAPALGLAGLGGNDRFTVEANADGSTVINTSLQQSDGDGGFLPNSLTNQSFEIASGTTVSIDGGGGLDTVEFIGKRDIGTGGRGTSFSIGANGVQLDEQMIELSGIANFEVNPGPGSVINLDGGISIPNFIRLTGDGLSSTELRVDLAGTTGDLRVLTGQPSRIKEGSNSITEIIEGFAGGGFVELGGVGTLSIAGNGDDNVTIATPQVIRPDEESDLQSGLLHVSGDGTGLDTIRRAGNWGIVTSGLNDLTIESTGGNGEVSFDVNSLSGANSYTANLRVTDVATLEGGNTLGDNLVIGRYGNAWHPVGAQITQGGSNVRVAGAGRLDVSTGGGDDTLTIDVDQSRGSDVIGLPIFFDGGEGGFDTLQLVGNPATAVENMNYRPGPDTHNGRLEFDDASDARLMTVEFSGLEPVRNNVFGKFHNVFGTSQAEDITYETVLARDGFPGSLKRHGQVAVGSMEVYQFLIEGVSPSPALSLLGQSGHDRFTVELPHRPGIDDLDFLNIHGENRSSPNMENDLVLLTSNGDETIEYEMNASAVLPDGLFVTQAAAGSSRFKLELFQISDITIPESGGADALQITGNRLNEWLEVERVNDVDILQTGYQKLDVRHSEFDRSFPGGISMLTVSGVKSVSADLDGGFDEFVAVGTEQGESFLVEAAQVTIGNQLSTPVSLSNHETVQIEADRGDDFIKVLNPLPIDITVNAGFGDSDVLDVEGRSASAEFLPSDNSRSGRVLVRTTLPEPERELDYSGVDTIRARFEDSDVFIDVHADNSDNDIRVTNPGVTVVDIDDRPSLELYDLGNDARLQVFGHAGADRFATTLSDVDVSLIGGRDDRHDVVTYYGLNVQYSPDATFSNGHAELVLHQFDEIIVEADSLVATSNDRVPAKSFRTVGASTAEARAFAFVTPGTGPGIPAVQLLGSDAETVLNDPDLPSNLNGGVIAVSGGLETHDNLFIDVFSSDGRAVSDFEIFATIVEDTEFTEESEPNNSTTDNVAIVINNDHRVAQRGAVPFGDTDLVSIVINNDHRIAAIVINNDHRSPGVLTHSVLEILDSDGETVLADGSNEAGSLGNATVTAPLPAGQYFVRISNNNPDGNGNYQLVIFDVNDDFAVITGGGSPINGDLEPGEHGKGSIPATPGKDDVVKLTPLGNKAAALRYNDAVSLELRSVDRLTIDPLGGNDVIHVQGSQNSDTFAYHGNMLTVNGQQFSHVNVEQFHTLAGPGSDTVIFDAEIDAANGFLIDGADGSDRVGIVLDGGNAQFMLSGAIQDSRLFETIGVERFSLQGSTDELGISTDILVAEAANSSRSVTVTPQSIDRVDLQSGIITAELITGGDITISSARPTSGTSLSIRQVDVQGTVFDDAIEVSDTGVSFAGPLKSVGLMNIPSVSVNGNVGRDTFNVAPSAQTAFHINGSDPIGFGDILNITTTLNSVRRLPGPTNDSGGLDVVGMKFINYEGIEFTTLPNRPVAITPTGSRNPTPYLEWQPVIDVVSYEVQLVNSATSGDPLIAVTTDRFFQPARPLAMGRYSFRVRGIRDDGGVTEFSDPVSFDVRPRTSIAVASRAKNGTPQIQWAPVEGALRYDLWISNNDVVGPPVIRERFVTETQFTPIGELPIGRYSVYVRPHGEGGYAGTWSGTPLHIATPTTITAPNSGTFDGLPTFEWEPVPGAETYDVWVRQLTPDVVDQVIRAKEVTATTFTATTALPDAEFIFWVKAQGANGFQSSWSSATRFNTFARPAIHGPTSKSAEVDSAVTWSAVQGATGYDLEVTDGEGSIIIAEQNLLDTSFQPARLFDPGAEYFVRARAIKNTIPGLWSPSHRFQTATAQVTLIGPGSTGPSEGLPPGRVRFSWNGVVGATRYELWVNQIGGTSRIVHERNLTATEFTSSALEAGRYRFWVRAINGAGRAGVWSSALEFTM